MRATLGLFAGYMTSEMALESAGAPPVDKFLSTAANNGSTSKLLTDDRNAFTWRRRAVP